MVTCDDVELLGVRIASREFMGKKLLDEIDECNTALSQIDSITEPRTKFHLHRICGSACRVQHIFRLVPPDIFHPYAENLDKDQILAYTRFSNVPFPTQRPNKFA